MKSLIAGFASDSTGSDLVEYTLLLAFIVLLSVAAIMGIGQSTSTIWSVSNTRLASAASNGGS